MFELAARLLISGALLFVSGTFGVPEFGIAWKASAALAALALFGSRLEARGLRNSGIAGFLAISDTALIAVVLASLGRLESLGFLVLGPCVYAVQRYRTDATYLAPLAAASLLGSHAIISSNKVPGPLLLAEAGGVMMLGLLLGKREPAEALEPVADLFAVMRHSEPEPLIEMRESYRSLRDAYQDLEKRTRRDRILALLADARPTSPDGFYQRLVDKLVSLCKPQSLVFYTMASYDSCLVARAHHGDVSFASLDSALRLDLRQSMAQIQTQALYGLRAMGDDDRPLETLLLNDNGHVVGMLTIRDDSPERLSEAFAIIEEAAPDLAALVRDAEQHGDTLRRMREAELLYEMASLASGAEARSLIAARAVQELSTLLGAEHVGVFLLEGGRPTPMARVGSDPNFIDLMSFSEGQGIAGWLNVGSPELLLFDARQDARCDPQATLRSRVGSFFLLPLDDGDGPYGFVTMSTTRVGGLDLRSAESFRIAVAELSRLLSDSDQSARGFRAPGEFYRAATELRGSIVVLDIVGRDRLQERFGMNFVRTTTRRLAKQVRTRLPRRGAICLSEPGRLLVHLPDFDQQKATSWINEAVALASMLELRTPDGTIRIPLGVRGRIGELDPQSNRISAAMSA